MEFCVIPRPLMKKKWFWLDYMWELLKKTCADFATRVEGKTSESEGVYVHDYTNLSQTTNM